MSTDTQATIVTTPEVKTEQTPEVKTEQAPEKVLLNITEPYNGEDTYILAGHCEAGTNDYAVNLARAMELYHVYLVNTTFTDEIKEIL